MNSDKYSKAIINSALLFIWTEFVFFLLLLIGISPLNFNPIGRSPDWIIAIHLFFVIIALLYGFLQPVVFCKGKQEKRKLFVFYGL